jgi:iron complex transport system substrate-binding protein
MRFAALILAGAAIPVQAAPLRIVSINPCVDAILMQVVDPGQIAGISHYSRDPRASSISPAQAARFTATSGTAEEVVALAPTLVIAGAHVEPATIAALKRMNIALLQLAVPETIAQSRDQISRIAAATGHPDRGARLNARIDAAVAAGHTAGPAVPALIWQGGGLVPGEATLASELLRRTGFHNLSQDYGLKKWDVLPLEHLVARSPRVLFSVGDARGGDRMLGHPALKRLAGHIAIRPYPERLLRCGGPTIIDAVAALASARRGLGGAS